MNRTVALCCLLGLAACAQMFGHPKTSGPSSGNSGGGGQKSEPVVASEAGGSHVVTGYNQAKRDLAAAEKASTPDDASWQYLSARATALKAQAFVKDAKASGSWTEGLMYKTEADGKMDEKAMLAALDTLVADTQAAWDKQKPAARKAWKKSYGVSSDEALDKLEELGKPASTKKEKKNTCWIFDTEDAKQTWCWTNKGKLAHKEVEKKQEAVASGGGDGGGGGGESAGPSGPTTVSVDAENTCDQDVHITVDGTYQLFNDHSHESFTMKPGDKFILSQNEGFHDEIASVVVDANTKTITVGCGSVSAH